jgi:starvation-inducible DNA-binding protein
MTMLLPSVAQRGCTRRPASESKRPTISPRHSTHCSRTSCALRQDEELPFFHWHVSGSNFRDYHLLLDEQGDQLEAATDPIAERVRKRRYDATLDWPYRSSATRVLDNDADHVTSLDMLSELREDNTRLADRMRETHGVCEEYGHVASASLLEIWIDEAERRAWFLFEATRRSETAGS